MKNSDDAARVAPADTAADPGQDHAEAVDVAARCLEDDRMECQYEIRFESLSNKGTLCFPCDEQGQVKWDSLSERARETYLYARAVVGGEYAFPRVCRASRP
jgi:hypothetical protein